MGFKPQKSLKIYYKVKPASFIYPDEQVEEDIINCSLYVANSNKEMWELCCIRDNMGSYFF